MTLTRCTLLGNVAQGGRGGDGGFNEPGTVAGNGGQGGAAEGGAISSGGLGGIALENCTLSDNHALGGGGGYPAVVGPGVEGTPGYGGFASGGALNGALVLESCTIARNSADGGGSVAPNRVGGGAGGGAEGVSFPLSSARNSIIALNTVSGSFTRGPDVADGSSVSPWVSQGWNLIGITDGSSGWTTNDFLGNSTFPLNPLLSPCHNNGGPIWTICPLGGSPARDKGNSNLATDARGGRRIVDFASIPNSPGGNGSDIGALEVDSLFRIVAFAKSNTFARVTFKSDPGGIYTVQQTSVLTNRVWTNVVTLPGTGQNLNATNFAPLPNRRFYRVRSD